MQKTFCDICGMPLVYAGERPTFKVKIKKFDDYSFEGNLWKTLDVCSCCQQAIVERSIDIRKGSGNFSIIDHLKSKFKKDCSSYEGMEEIK